MDEKQRNVVDRDKVLGQFKASYKIAGESFDFLSEDLVPQIIVNDSAKLVFSWTTPQGLLIKESFLKDTRGTLDWTFKVENKNNVSVEMTDFGFELPILNLDRKIKATDNYCRHHSVNGHSSFLYWNLYSGEGDKLILVPNGKTALEYTTRDNWYFTKSSTVVDRDSDDWGIPSSSTVIRPGAATQYSFTFSKVVQSKTVEDALYENGIINVRVVPGMTVPRGEEVLFALRGKGATYKISSEYPEKTQLVKGGKSQGFSLYKVTFDKLGENTLTVSYLGKKMYLEFFVTEPVETLIKKRAAFITERQQHTDPTKWYNGLYSLYDMEKNELLSPDYLGDLRQDFMVGVSDDPSNSKPVFLSEKNVAFPDSSQIASLEYYQQNFVWGKLQRTDKEYPYPYGIYGSENWYDNRSGRSGDYGSGGWGKERMWRTFDYTTHLAIYYNLYLIATENPQWVHYLDADGYLDRAYHTAMAFFEVPYNIIMGEKWAFHGWCDWAYKQGNFHERYILDIISALEEHGRQSDADKLRREWEKKVTYMLYENPWPFGSEMFVDRTAFESSYYVGEYALTEDMIPQENFWYDKNAQKWYSYKEYPQEPKERFMINQLNGNLALRAIYEPGYHSLGTAWGGGTTTLEYMCQMGGVALLDYAARFADAPADYVRYGYNSVLASWALVNSGDQESNYGYWYNGKERDGAIGWAFSYYQNSHPYMRYIDVGRGPWRWDGEIDHGLTGAVHGTGAYVVNDPVFGEICYGGRLQADMKTISVESWDGVRKHFVFPDLGRFEFTMKNDGLQDGRLEISRDLSRMSFTIEQRSMNDHLCEIELRNLPKGQYTLRYNDSETVLNSNKDITLLQIPVNAKSTHIEIHKTL